MFLLAHNDPVWIGAGLVIGVMRRHHAVSANRPRMLKQKSVARFAGTLLEPRSRPGPLPFQNLMRKAERAGGDGDVLCFLT